MKLHIILGTCIAISLAGNVQAQTATWTDGAPGDHLWSTPGN